MSVAVATDPQPGAASVNPPTTPQAGAQGGTTTPPNTAVPTSTETGEPDLEKVDAGTKAYIQSLRKENAKYRTEAKTTRDKLDSVGKALGVSADETHEQKAARLSAEKETVTFENAVLHNAIEHGVPKESMEFFEFKLAKARNELGDGEELAPEKIAAFAKEAKAIAVRPNANTTVTTPTAQGVTTASAPAPAGNSETMTVEKFAALGFGEKVKLFESNQSLYESLMAQATQKRLIK